MSNHFNYYLKPEERKSLKPQKPPTRKWNFILLLANVALLLLIFFLVYKPAVEKLNKENRFYIENFSIEVEYDFSGKEIFIDLYIYNEGEDNEFDFSRLNCYLVFTDSTEINPKLPKFDKEKINGNSGIHYILSYLINDHNKTNTKFFIRIIYDNKKRYESRIISFGANN